MNVQQYIADVSNEFKTGRATEHSYRGYLQNLIKSIVDDVMVTNEPQRIKCGAPDYILTKKDIPVGYIEAKDLGMDLNSKSHAEQFNRYKEALNNLIFTNYLDFQVFKDGEKVAEFSIGKIEGNKVVANVEQFEYFKAVIKDFATTKGQTIKSSQKLAEMMASKAKLLATVINEALTSDVKNEENSSLKDQLAAFKEILIHDIKPKEFADIYAQTIAYGMFAARLHDTTLETFTRKEAAELIPKSNPFLRKLFQYIAGFDLDERVIWIVDDLADIFRATDVAAMLKNFGKSTQQTDPIIHFYETFLAQYDPKLRKARGVWYTPEPVVKFIVKAVDDILKTEFGLADGLADNSKTKIKIDVQGKKEKQEVEVHKVQILDPATGTGTFLAEVVKYIYNTKFDGQQGIWSNYVENDLMPRLNGFELLMASYAMAHLKLELLLNETGYKPKKEQRLRVYLTNSLEEHHADTGTLFAQWLSSEANEANRIKRDTPVMCVIGNPPYSVSSSNKSEWIQNLIVDYKKDLNERKINLDDDYIKFIRFGQHFIDKNGSGILAYISNNSFINGITHRQMRKHLLESFDKIYILDLHGNAKKKEVSPDGTPDQNVFDIMQGVSINIFVKTGEKKKNILGKVFHFDLHGKRESKYETLVEENFKTISWNTIKFEEPYNFFVPKNFTEIKKYEEGFKIDEFLSHYNSGIQTKNDEITIQINESRIKEIVKDFQLLDTDELNRKYNIKEGVWKTSEAKKDILSNKFKFAKIEYKPFDTRFTVLTEKSSGFLGRPREKTMRNMIQSNLGICLMRTLVDTDLLTSVYLTKNLLDINFYRFQTFIFPLYLYPEIQQQQSIESNTKRTPNLDAAIVKTIADKLGLQFTNEKETTKNTFAPIDLLDYIYAVLHSPKYREQYKEFLKIDFPRVPYPTNKETFWQLVKLGGELRQLHLLESATVNKFITKYPVDGSNAVDKIKFETDKVWINETQYFSGVSATAWNFYIGGYQPAQKWLKDRKQRVLSYDDILHYQKMIVALTETDWLMKAIDEIEIV